MFLLFSFASLMFPQKTHFSYFWLRWSCIPLQLSCLTRDVTAILWFRSSLSDKFSTMKPFLFPFVPLKPFYRRRCSIVKENCLFCCCVSHFESLVLTPIDSLLINDCCYDAIRHFLVLPFFLLCFSTDYCKINQTGNYLLIIWIFIGF